MNIKCKALVALFALPVSINASAGLDPTDPNKCVLETFNNHFRGTIAVVNEGSTEQLEAVVNNPNSPFLDFIYGSKQEPSVSFGTISGTQLINPKLNFVVKNGASAEFILGGNATPFRSASKIPKQQWNKHIYPVFVVPKGAVPPFAVANAGVGSADHYRVSIRVACYAIF